MEHWNEIRTAASVARLGTISSAADALGVHRATVNRHVDRLEEALGAKLFQRHARGFTATDLGRELLRVAEATEEQFVHLQRSAQRGSEELSGDFIVTSVDSLAVRLMPILRVMGHRHPGLAVRFIGSDSLLRLEYGEAHVAMRVGEKPQDPDNVVRRFGQSEMGLYASTAYIDIHGLPSSPADLPEHRFIGPDAEAPRPRFLRWMVSVVPEAHIVFRTNRMPILSEAVRAGLGLGFLPRVEAEGRDDLVEVMPPLPDWTAPIWIVTHVDLHRSAKVQAFLEILKALDPAD